IPTSIFALYHPHRQNCIYDIQVAFQTGSREKSSQSLSDFLQIDRLGKKNVLTSLFPVSLLILLLSFLRKTGYCPRLKPTRYFSSQLSRIPNTLLPSSWLCLSH